MQNLTFQYQNTSFRIPVSEYQFQNPSLRVLVSEPQFQNTSFRIQVSEPQFQNPSFRTLVSESDRLVSGSGSNRPRLQVERPTENVVITIQENLLTSLNWRELAGFVAHRLQGPLTTYTHRTGPVTTVGQVKKHVLHCSASMLVTRVSSFYAGSSVRNCQLRSPARLDEATPGRPIETNSRCKWVANSLVRRHSMYGMILPYRQTTDFRACFMHALCRSH